MGPRNTQRQAPVRLQLLAVRTSAQPHGPKHDNGTDGGANEPQQRELPSVRATPINAPEAKRAIEHSSHDHGEARKGQEDASWSRRVAGPVLKLRSNECLTDLPIQLASVFLAA